MRIAYLILAHNQPNQLKRLITRLTEKNADVFVHLDAKSAFQPFEALVKLPGVYFIKNRVKVYWGSFNIVQATINGFYEILATGGYGYINLLSGQDYPLKSNEELLDFLSENPDKAFMNSLVAQTHWLEALPRVQEYHLNNYPFPGRYLVQKAINTLMPQRRIPNDLILVGRSQWFTASVECIKYIVDYWEKHPALRRFMKFTWAPDEFIFQTILYNSHLRDRMVDEDLRYIDWSGGGASPKLLTMEDAPKLISSNKFFARKFDAMKDSAVLDYIDNHLLKK
ncbi:glycosyl transferase [Mucilaginibacter limnophilus]|uniref:Peptide O-xylosyltransferase n=1 Tax=Mucilaginibacter limnophilus TaxID=1932778 RepID=A0A437MYF3_9SPHI|nr:beta-1,6-N-acetylglucosaminyltransferase [Mucilaginibacter limnophilus]RVU02712.1 glycosyl transferase [Mucilaginibacter limnophilus]